MGKDVSNNGEFWRKHIDLNYSRKGQDIRYALNDDKLRNLGWEPKHTFNDKLPKMVEYYKEKFIW